MNQVPPYIEMADIAKACDWRTEKARRVMRRAGIADWLGGRWVVGEGQLRERLPDVYERVYAYFCIPST